MQFTHPWAFALLWLLPVLLALGVWSHGRRRRAMERFARMEQFRELLTGANPSWHAARATLFLLAVGLLAFAAAGPRWGFQWEEIRRKGVDVVVALDLSRSMLAQDVQPSRLERAKREIQDLIDMMQGDRVGLVAFAGVAYVQVPLTLDYGVFHVFLDALDTDLVPVQGTDLGAAVDAAVKAFDPASHTGKAVILITDGEDNEGRGLEAARKAKEAGVRIFTVGIGGGEGAPIPAAEGGGFHKARGGEMVMSRLDESALQKIALETGGAYVRSVSGDMDLQEIYLRDIRERMEQRDLASTRQKRWEERFQWPLAAALALLFAESWLGRARRRRAGAGLESVPARAPSRGAAAWAALALTAAVASPASALAEDPPFTGKSLREGWAAYQRGEAARKAGDEEGAKGFFQKALEGFLGAQVERPEDPRLDYDVGAGHYRNGAWAEAEQAYARAARDPRLEQKATYNIGNARFQQGRLEEAIEAYQRAVELAPADEDAKHNLEYAREELKRRMEQAKQTAQQKPPESSQQKKDRQEQSPEQQAGKGEEGEPPPDGSEQERRDGPRDPRQAEGEPPPPPREGEGERDAPADASPEPTGEEEPPPGEADEPPLAEGELTPEEAERLLQSLKEDRRKYQGRPRGSRSRGKDW
ncbi:VWA domain-containing protein [Myxococcota bacterium]|nr:VWA domain-containing protein [Myxococcota bacterium]